MENIVTNVNNYFKDLKFDEATHTYTKLKKKLTPVSYVLKKFTEEFDSDKMSVLVANKRGITKEEVLKEWEDNKNKACELGTKVHLFGENYCRNKNLKPSNGYEEAITKWYFTIPDYIEPLFLELQMYSEALGIAGTADMVFYNTKTNKFLIRDYKGLPLDTPIFTSEGWKTMGELKVGDKVYDKDGNLCNVKNKSNIHNKPCMKIKLDNNVEIVCDEEHRWLISFLNKSIKNEWTDKVVTAKELFNYLNNVNANKLGYIDSYKKPKIRLQKPLNNQKLDLPIDPYVLGIWLGDGHSSCGMITQANNKVWEEIEKRGYSLGNDVSKGGSGKAQSRTVLGLSRELNKLNLLKNKHLPYIYLLSSEEQRIDLLRGFMDSDGYFNKGRKRFVMSTTKKYQVDITVQLCNSLGIKTTVIPATKCCNNKKIQGYDICFSNPHFNPFLYRNEYITYSYDSSRCKHTFYNIKSVEYTETVETQCIEVDSPTHTYLFGYNFIVTHNTNQDLFKNYKGKKMLKPFNNLLDNPYNKYQLQLSLYQILFEQTGYEIESRALVWIKPNGTYEVYKTEDYTKQLLNILGK